MSEVPQDIKDYIALQDKMIEQVNRRADYLEEQNKELSKALFALIRLFETEYER